jgi:hypothetical protein
MDGWQVMAVLRLRQSMGMQVQVAWMDRSDLDVLGGGAVARIGDVGD